MSADSELNSILNRRQQINDALENGETVQQVFRPGNIYTEFSEFSRKQIKDYQSTFNMWVIYFVCVSCALLEFKIVIIVVVIGDSLGLILFGRHVCQTFFSLIVPRTKMEGKRGWAKMQISSN